jgi:hypothetical protein
MTSEKELKEAISKDNTTVISIFSTQYAEDILDTWNLSSESKDQYVEAAVEAVMNLYKKFDPKKTWNKAVPYVKGIIEKSISNSIWSKNS